MMYLKIMGSENMPDHDQSKPHCMIKVDGYTINKGLDGDLYIRWAVNGEDHSSRVYSNIYVMNADGKTINSIIPPSGSPTI